MSLYKVSSNQIIDIYNCISYIWHKYSNTDEIKLYKSITSRETLTDAELSILEYIEKEYTNSTIKSVSIERIHTIPVYADSNDNTVNFLTVTKNVDCIIRLFFCNTILNDDNDTDRFIKSPYFSYEYTVDNIYNNSTPIHMIFVEKNHFLGKVSEDEKGVKEFTEAVKGLFNNLELALLVDNGDDKSIYLNYYTPISSLGEVFCYNILGNKYKCSLDFIEDLCNSKLVYKEENKLCTDLGSLGTNNIVDKLGERFEANYAKKLLYFKLVNLDMD